MVSENTLDGSPGGSKRKVVDGKWESQRIVVNISYEDSLLKKNSEVRAPILPGFFQSSE
jgi:hypothetical protein